MLVRIVSCAEQEFVEAIGYYNEQRPGLGFEFATEVKTTFNRILSFPLAWPQFSSRSRRCPMDRFPYAILYQPRTDLILVTAIMHLRRDPEKWETRNQIS